MNLEQRVYDLLMEGITTGGDPEATGRRVGHFVGRTNIKALSKNQRYRHIRRITSIHHKLRKRAGEFNSPTFRRAGEKADKGHIEGRSAVKTGITAPDHYETGQHLINQTRSKAGKRVRSMSTTEGLRKEFRKWRAYTNTNMAAMFAQSAEKMGAEGAPQKNIDKEHNRGARAGNKAYKYWIKLGLSPEQARTRVISNTGGTLDVVEK